MSPSSIAPEWVQRKFVVGGQAVRTADRQPEVRTVRRSRLYEPAKRTMDLTLSAVGLILSSPLFALIAVAIKLESRGPVFFGHERLGMGGRSFRCLKFRSMLADADDRLRSDPQLKHRYVENDFKIPLDQDPRVTRVGRFLRKSSLDELPQLFNVLTGTMSLVGPRPIVHDELKWYSGREPILLSVRPGITGEWQIQGRSRIGYPERAEIELQAIQGCSLPRDLLILLKSIPAVITARGSL